VVCESAESYLSRSDFLASAFDNRQPIQKMLWLDNSKRNVITEILGHPYLGLRIRYWKLGDRLAWIIDEIGKESPITIGIVVDNSRIADVTILDFRETRGGEVRYEFFTGQFPGVGLRSDLLLDQDIDGITGATLSVRAVKASAALALYLSQSVIEDTGPHLQSAE
jgi:hypothetical protein